MNKIYISYLDPGYWNNLQPQGNQYIEEQVEMETFVKKACYGSGPHFNSIREERGRWISKEAQRHDMKMTNIIIDIL
jgi:hypothetical protein